MYLYLGKAAVVRRRDVIGIFDLDNTTASRLTRDFLARAERDSRVKSAAADLPRSFVLTETGGVYLSPFSPATLCARAESDGIS